MIKVGQVYKCKQQLPDGIYVVTKKNYKSCGRYPQYDVIRQDGVVWDLLPETYFEKYMELIAEYPTWQEAVNSKEFRDD